MKVINFNERRYYFDDNDRRVVREALNYNHNITWLWNELNYKSHTTWYRKFNNYNNAWFTELEVKALESLLSITLDRH